MNTEILRIAIDGGPCSGKTTGMSYILRELAERGIIAVIVPEAATLLIQSGIAPWTVGIESFQTAVARLQISNEEVWLAEAKALQQRTGKRCVLLCDRGLVGAAAYLPGDNPLQSLNSIFDAFGTNIEEARVRYAGVIHMVTAANGAEAFYTLANNEARKESPEEARKLDARTIAAWLGHPHLAVVANVNERGESIPFEKKIHKALAEVLRILGYPEPLEIEDKYLLSGFDPTSIPVAYEAINIEQTYLVPNERGTEERLRMREWLGSRSYFHTTKKPSSDGARIEIERTLTENEYHELLKRADQKKQPIQKERYCFVWDSQYFEVDVFSGRHQGLILMERERTGKNDTTRVPPFVEIVRDVTNEQMYKNSALAAA